MKKRVVLATLFVAIGFILIFAVPTPAEGPTLIFLSDEQAIRFIDAIGLMLALPSWFYLNLIALRFPIERWIPKS